MQLKTKELLTHHCGCHSDIVTKTMGVLLMFIVIRKLYTKCKLNTTKDKAVIDLLLWLLCNLNTIKVRKVVDAYYPKEPPCQI